MKNENKRDDSRFIFAIVLIIVGIIWALRRIGFNFEILGFFREHFFDPFRHFFSRTLHIVFSWQMIILMVGIVLLAGRRPIGWVLLVIGCIFLIPRVFNMPELSVSLLLPFALVAFGIVMVVRAL